MGALSRAQEPLVLKFQTHKKKGTILHRISHRFTLFPAVAFVHLSLCMFAVAWRRTIQCSWPLIRHLKPVLLRVRSCIYTRVYHTPGPRVLLGWCALVASSSIMSCVGSSWPWLAGIECRQRAPSPAVSSHAIDCLPGSCSRFIRGMLS
jgi:hypothetical protein